MIRIAFGLFTLCTFLVVAATPAEAKPKLWIFGWGPSHWEGQDFKPFLMPPAHPHNRQWDLRLEDKGKGNYEQWTVEDWEKSDNGEAVINGFFEADILRDQIVRRNVPVLVVGPNFYNLSGFDKRRVTDLMNSVYNITDTRTGHFQLKDDETGELIGYYDRFGLRLR